ncbi:hypothetical protein ADUPG1_011202 [Aduncisulcus paluster]|uniref:Translation initiation factor eIF2B subunit gamma n=1 Tax=Aduncisulcus paluster TaxID=2918883 RepID=A0ABQ5JZS3_9EUKA|nr:hypothetical protein ADUPG1_011202 [Aduncisulcus paluster]
MLSSKNLKVVVLVGFDEPFIDGITVVSSTFLLPIANRPLLCYVLQSIESLGFTDVTLVCKESIKDDVSQVLETYKHYFSLTSESISLPSHFTTLRAITCDKFLDHVKNDFVLFSSDTICKFSPEEFRSIFSEHKAHKSSFSLIGTQQSAQLKGIRKEKGGVFLTAIEPYDVKATIPNYYDILSKQASKGKRSKKQKESAPKTPEFSGSSTSRPCVLSGKLVHISFACVDRSDNIASIPTFLFARNGHSSIHTHGSVGGVAIISKEFCRMLGTVIESLEKNKYSDFWNDVLFLCTHQSNMCVDELEEQVKSQPSTDSERRIDSDADTSGPRDKEIASSLSQKDEDEEERSSETPANQSQSISDPEQPYPLSYLEILTEFMHAHPPSMSLLSSSPSLRASASQISSADPIMQYGTDIERIIKMVRGKVDLEAKTRVQQRVTEERKKKGYAAVSSSSGGKGGKKDGKKSRAAGKRGKVGGSSPAGSQSDGPIIHHFYTRVDTKFSYVHTNLLVARGLVSVEEDALDKRQGGRLEEVMVGAIESALLEYEKELCKDEGVIISFEKKEGTGAAFEGQEDISPSQTLVDKYNIKIEKVDEPVKLSKKDERIKLAAQKKMTKALFDEFPEMECVYLGSKVEIGGKSTVRNTVIGPYVHIGKNCIIEDCVLQKGVKIGDNCTVRGCVIGSDSRVGDHCELENVCAVRYSVKEKSTYSNAFLVNTDAIIRK